MSDNQCQPASRFANIALSCQSRPSFHPDITEKQREDWFKPPDLIVFSE